MSIKLAIQDLANVLSQSQFIDRVDGLPIRAGSSRCRMEILVGTQYSVSNFGKTRTIQELDLTLTLKIAVEADQLAEITKEIDKEIIKDRRRSGQAQTTVLSETGWVPEETTGKSPVVISRTCEVHYYEDQV